MSGLRRKLSILLLCDDNRQHANTLLEHIEAFRRYSAYDIRTFNPRSLRRSSILDLGEFDVVVIHYSLCIVVDDYLAPDFREKLRKYNGLKIQFIQDDYRWVDSMTAMMRYVGIHVLFTLVPPPEIPRVWGEDRLPAVVKINTLAGYVPETLVGMSGFPLGGRPIDVGYRGRELPFWIGRLGQEKVRIGREMLARAAEYGLRCDIRWTEQDRIYGQAWNRFLSSCRATLGTESGASITDFDGSIERRTKEYLALRPTADFEEVYGEILWEFEGNVRMNVISPRIFEAIALRTALVLFPGEYSGVIQPHEHYVLLKKDFSNMDEVAERLRDIEGLNAMSERAYRDVVQSGKYSLRSFIHEFDRVVGQYAKPCGRISKVRFQAAQLEKVARIKFIPVLDGSRIARLARLIVKAGVSLRMGFGCRETRALLVRWVTCPGARKRVRPRALLKDMFRLGILRRVRGGGSIGGEPFWVSVRVATTGVEFLSHPGRVEGDQGRTSWARQQWTDGTMSAACAALESGRFTIVWNHAVLGCSVPYPLTVLEGVHDFPALREIGKHSPEAAWAAIATLLPEDRRE